MSKRDNMTLIHDMLESALKIKKYTQEYDYNKFIEDDKTIDAVVRNFEIIGEASSKIDPDYKIDHANIPWRKLKGYRNRLIHEYFGVDYQIVWEIIQDDLSGLIEAMEEIISS
ncbi:MAG: DUF86 domain-containing protein [Bacteroidia bacterium]